MSTSNERVAVVAGGSGFLGRVFLDAWLARPAHAAVVLSRRAAPARVREGVRWCTWDAATLGDWAGALDGAAAVVNLVGRSVDCRKTPVNRAAILRSRVDSTWALGEACRSVACPPPVWLQSGTAHIVGDPVPLDAVCDEATPAGEGLAPEVATAWEAAFDEALLPSQRGVLMRTSFVLGRGGGALVRLARLARWGLGGRVGHGRQWISWLHEDDFAGFAMTAIDDAAYDGVYLLTAPEPVTNAAFMRALRKAVDRPWSPPAPAWGVRLASRWLLNTDPELALLGRRCVPTRLLAEHGFGFRWPGVEDALADLL